MARYGIQVMDSNLELLNHRRQQEGARSLEVFDLKKDNLELRFEISGPFSERDARKLIQSSESAFLRLFQPTLTPYPGQISEKIHCPDDFKPKKIDLMGLCQKKAYAFLAKASARKTLGVCKQDQIAFDSLWTNFILPSGHIVKIVGFRPVDKLSKDRFVQALGALTCID